MKIIIKDSFKFLYILPLIVIKSKKIYSPKIIFFAVLLRLSFSTVLNLTYFVNFIILYRRQYRSSEIC